MYSHQHPNGLHVVGLAPSHPLRRPDGPRIVELRFRPGIAENEVHGKRNKGAATVTSRTVLADLKLSDGAEFTLHAGVSGALVELNERLTKEPTLLQGEEAEDEGFLAIVHPRKP